MGLPDEQDSTGLRTTVSAAEFAALGARVERLEHELAALAGVRGKVEQGPGVELRTEPVAPPPPVLGVPVVLSAPPPAQSLESRLGSQVFSRVGIVALLIGAAAALKLAIDSQWIGESGRIGLGLLAGVAIVLWSERFRRKGFPAFSYSLKAVGTGVLYLALWAAYQLYHLLPAPVALGAMIVVTAWNAWMAWAQDAELLAGYAIIGAFATPLLLSNGGNHELFLFTYIAAIDIATVVLLRLKPWHRLLLGAFPGTVAFYMGWSFEHYHADELALTSFFVVLFFAIFIAPSLMPQPHEQPNEPAATRKRDTGAMLRLLLMLGNAAFVSLALYAIIEGSYKDFVPWLMVLLGAIYLGLMRLQRTAAARGVHLSLAVVFLTIAIPLKASGRWITIGWLVEGVALLGVSASLLRSVEAVDETGFAVYRLLRLLGMGALALGFLGLVSLPWWLFGTLDAAFLNARFATALVGIAAFALATWVALHAKKSEREGSVWLQVAAVCVVAINIVALQAGVLEIEMFWRIGAGPSGAQLQTALSISAYLMLYGAALLAVGFRARSGFLRWQALGLLIFTIAKTFLYDVRSLSEGYRVASFLGLGVLLMTVSFAYQKDWLGLRENGTKPSETQT